MGRLSGSSDVNTPFKARVSREFQRRGGADTRGAAAQTARAFDMRDSGAASRVKRYDEEIRTNDARRKTGGVVRYLLGASRAPTMSVFPKHFIFLERRGS